MKLHELQPAAGSVKDVKRIGRGHGSGNGKTAGKGHKGQKARSGGSIRPGFEGGQMPLQRRMPKRGFNNIFALEYATVNVAELESRFENGAVVEQGLVSDIFTNPKTEVTKDFIKNIIQTLGDDKNEGMLRWSDEGGKYVLHFINEDTGKPVISQVCKRFDVDINIRAGGIQHLPSKDIGSMIIDIIGSEAEVQKAVEFIRQSGVAIEEDK